MTDVTRILSDIEQGDPAAAEQLLPLVYEELRKLATQKMVQEEIQRASANIAVPNLADLFGSGGRS